VGDPAEERLACPCDLLKDGIRGLHSGLLGPLAVEAVLGYQGLGFQERAVQIGLFQRQHRVFWPASFDEQGAGCHDAGTENGQGGTIGNRKGAEINRPALFGFVAMAERHLHPALLFAVNDVSWFLAAIHFYFLVAMGRGSSCP
jgi:hypothetical protein